VSAERAALMLKSLRLYCKKVEISEFRFLSSVNDVLNSK
jgi:hypothetical protein